jgi:hypothetical protein
MYYAVGFRRFVFFFAVLLVPLLPLWPQNIVPQEYYGEPLSFVGMVIDELFARFGPPQSVYASRGEEHWQDDVVFVYNEGDFYIHGRRVWQVGLREAFGIRIGDLKAVAHLLLGENVQDEGDFLLYHFPGGAWPVSIRINLTNDRVSAIFVYRPDFY